MVSKTKLYTKLDSLEQELKEGLRQHLKDAIERDNHLVFCVPAFNPFRELKNRTDSKTQHFVDLGSQILSLRNKLDEPSAGTLAERICWFCRQWADSASSPDSPGLDLAKTFLAEIENEQP